MPKRRPDEVTQGTDHLEKLFSAIASYMDRHEEERIRRVIVGPLFELSGIPERELNKWKQDEECLEITSYMDDVRAPSHMNDHLSNYRYVRTHDASPDDKSNDFCVIDVSTGSTPATNVKEWNTEDDTTDSKVLMQLYGQIADNYKPDTG